MDTKLKQVNSLLLGALLSSTIQAAPSTENIFQDVIVVTGVQDNNQLTDTLYGDTAPAIAPDAAYMVSRLPGAALINNGSLSGQVQYRGAYGARVGSKINGHVFHSGGPNLMDPPMHYAPPPLVASIEVSRGASAVAFGPSLIGGVNTVLKNISYGESSQFETHYDVTAIGRTSDNSHALGGNYGFANDRLRILSLFSTEEGDNADYPGGQIENTFHERRVFGLVSGFRDKTNEFSLELRRQETGPTGNPPFAMDIKFVDTDFAKFDYRKDLDSMMILASIGYSDVDHGMTNFESRPVPSSPMRYRYTRAGAKTLTAALGLEMEIGKGELQVGIDANQGELASRITNPNDALFYIDNLPGIEVDRYGLYLDWTRSLGDWDMSLGARVDQHETDAGIAETGPAVADMPKMLAMKFNQSDRTWQDTTGDFVTRFWGTANRFTWRASIARKNRVPGHLERYAWLPTPASTGLADGNNYVGDLELDPETAWIVEAGFDFNGDRWWVRPTIYYHQVDDFLQGVPFDDSPDVVDHPVEMVSAMNGDSTPLRFANVDAKMFGIDADYGVQLANRWRLEGVLSVVRGERRDINDDLYRISPDRLTLGVVYETARWMMNLEGVLVDAQNKVSSTNHEETTSGYGLVNLYSQWKARDGLTVSAGLENIFDKQYQGHLNGYNRIADSDVAMGERVPGTGRNLYLRIQLKH